MKALNKYDIKYDKAITKWDEALPLGNGRLGCLIYGDGVMRLSLDRVDLWDERPAPATQEKEFNFAELLRLVKDGSDTAWQEYTRLFDSVYDDTPYPTKLTAGRIELDFGVKTQDIVSSVSLVNAVANVSFFAKNDVSIESFVSATHYLGLARIYGDYTLNLRIPNYISGGNDTVDIQDCAEQNGRCLNYPKAKIVREGNFIYYNQKTATDFSYGIVVYEKNCNGYKELYFTIATNNDSDNFIDSAKETLKNAANIGYDALKEKHVEWWNNYWNRSSISVGDELLEKTYYRSWYLFASCSRKGGYPMPLQGVWTADNDMLPPWKGDYHHDTNTQLSYQSYLKANRLDEGVCFVDYLWSLKDEYKRFAKNFYGVDGLLIPGVSTLHGKPMGGWAQYSLSPTMTIWSAQSFDEYYLYTGDEVFLREKAYPFFVEIEKAIFSLLEEKNGKLYLPLSSSPEIFDATRKAYLQPNSNFDLALLRYLYTTLCKYSNRLGYYDDEKRYGKVLSKLDEVAVIDGIIGIDKNNLLPKSHRHFSHLMCLYPLHLINYDTDEHKALYDTSLAQIEELGQGFWVGFSFGMCAQIYAITHNGNSAYEKLRQFAHGFVAENGFHLNGDFKGYGYSALHYRPFTLESSFGFCDALQEMLLQEHEGYIYLFPAIPDEWKKRCVEFTKLRSYGGVEVSAKLNCEKVVDFSLTVDKTVTLRIKNVFEKEKLEFSNGQSVNCPCGEVFELTITAGETALLI